MPSYTPHRRIVLKNHPEFTERWLQNQIAEDPTILGLGEVDVKDIERVQPRAGRLDLLLFDPETTTRYEVELQLGATDESHIIRTIEYWDLERRRYPQYEHVAVIIAEEITARFFNVISLFNGFIPIIAIQLQAIEVKGHVTLVFTTVLDRMTLGIEEEEETDREPRDRTYWENRATPEALAATDRLLEIVREFEPRAELNYRKRYIGLGVDGRASNFVSFRPKKKQIIAEFRIPRTEELSERIETSGLSLLRYNARGERYHVGLREADIESERDLLRHLAKLAQEGVGA